MTNLFPILGVSLAAFCVWLAVRIISRRERWAKRIAVALAAGFVYGLSFGPACWLTSHLGRGTKLLPTVYRPLMALLSIGEERERWQCAAYSWAEGRPERVPAVSDGRLAWFARLAAPAGWSWRYCAIYTYRPNRDGDGRIRLGDEAWEWSNR